MIMKKVRRNKDIKDIKDIESRRNYAKENIDFNITCKFNVL